MPIGNGGSIGAAVNGGGYPPFCPWERRAALFCPPAMISLLIYCLVLHTSYASVFRISIAMLSVGAWSGLASIAGVALLSRISRITLVTRSSGVALLSRISRVTLVTRSSGVAGVPPVTRLA